MRPDPEFDCLPGEKAADGKCMASLFTGPSAKPYQFTGLGLLDRIAKNPQIRTLIFGHTHYNSYEMWQAGDTLLPGKIAIDDLAVKKFASREIENPVRGFASVERQHPFSSNRPSDLTDPHAAARRVDYDPNELEEAEIDRRVRAYATLFETAAKTVHRTLDAPAGKPRELAILRLTCNADLTSQKYQTRAMYGFSVLTMSKRTDARAYDNPQVNRVTFFINAGNDRFDLVKTVDIDRTVKITTSDPKNPVGQLFQ
jgi:hypothetical protein